MAPTTDWNPILRAEFEKPYWRELQQFVADERARGQVFPPHDQVFSALHLTPYAGTRVLILGQDPYHGPGQAHGLSFSVKRPRKPPPSLKNIYKEIAEDLGLPTSTHGQLTHWADQGVLLLNTVLTVRHKAAGSHRRRGWERFTDHVIDALVAREAPMAFLLWGKAAQQKAERIPPRHLVLQAPHPSPYSAHTGFFGCRHFSRVNTWLEARGHAPIDWSVPD